MAEPIYSGGTSLTRTEADIAAETPLDRKYSDREARVRWYGVMQDAELNLPAEAGPVPTPEAVAAAPKGAEPTPAPPAPGRGGAAVETPPPGAPSTTPPGGQAAPAVAPLPLNVAETLSRLAGQPLPLTTAAQAAFNAAAETAKHLVFGAKQTVFPEETPAGKKTRAGGAAEGHPILGAVTGRMADHARGVYEFIVEGLMGAIGIPFTAIEAGLEQQIENQNPAALDTVVLDSGPAAVVRNFTGQGNPLEPLGENPTEEARARQAWLNSPMTLREALHIGVQTAPFWMPGAARGATKGAQRVGRALTEQAATLKGERGALGFPPEPGTPTTPVERGSLGRPPAHVTVEKSPDFSFQGTRTNPDLIGPEDVQFVAKNARGDEVGMLRVTQEPGGFTVRDVQVPVESQRQGIATALYQQAARAFGPHLGSTAVTTEGKALLTALKQSNPEIFGGPAASVPAGEGPRPLNLEREVTPAEGPPRTVGPEYYARLVDEQKQRVTQLQQDADRAFQATNAKGLSESEFHALHGAWTDAAESLDRGRAQLEHSIAAKELAEARTNPKTTPEQMADAQERLSIAQAELGGIGEDPGAFGQPIAPPDIRPPGAGPRPLNLERIDAPDAVKAVMQRLDELVNAGEPLKGHRARQTHAETIALAKQRGLNLERMMKQDPTTFLPDEAKQTALRDAHNAAAQVLDDLERRMAAGDPVARAEYTAAFGVAMKLGELDVAAGTNLARGLESRTIASKAERAQMQGMADLAAKIKNISGVAPEELAAMRAHLNAAQQMTWMQALGASAAVTRDVLHTLWIQSLLTNPVTHTVNPFGTFAGIAWDAVAERPMAELVNRWLTRDPEGIAAGEALQAVSHPIEAMKDAVRLLGETWKTGQSPFEKDTRVGGLFEGAGGRFGAAGRAVEGVGETTAAGKAGVPRINAEKYGWSSENLPGSFVSALGAGLDNPLLPTGWLRLEDAVPKGVAYRMEIGAQSVWQATAEMRAAEAAGTPMTPDQFAARVKDLQLNPTPAMVKAAGDHAVQITMNADLGPVGQLVTKLANTAPFGRWLVPFIRWGGNAFSFAAQRLPVTGEISALMGKNRADFEAGGRLRDQAIARMIVGHGVALLIHQEVYSGNLTGSGAITQKMAGERPFRECPSYSMKIGGDCMPANYLRTLGQVGLLIAAVADHAELSREIPDQRWYDEWAAQASAIAMALGYTFVQQSAMQGLANVLEAIKDPVRKGNAIGLGFARSAIPAGVRQLTRVRDDNVIREVHSMTDALRSGLPWTVDGVAPKRHPITGAVRHMPAGYGWDLVSPVFWQNANTDPVDAAIIANDIGQGFVLPSSIGGSNNPGDIPRMTEPLPGEGVRLTPLERDRWIDHMTEDKVHGLTLHETLMETIQSERYKAGAPGPGGMRAFLITKEVQAFRKAGLVALLKDPRHPDLEARYEAAIRNKANALRPQADPRNPLNPQRNTLNPAQLLQSLGR